MPGNENKENDLIIPMDDEGMIPHTPVHLLKRTRSTVLKPPALAEKPDIKNAPGDVPGRNISPLRRLCVQQGRQPLASKDNNRANGTVNQQQSQGVQGTTPVLGLKDNTIQLKKQKQPLLERQRRSEHGHVLANPRKLKKYGSVLGCNTLPKMKSLVLKDVNNKDVVKIGVGNEEDEEDEEEDDEEETNVLKLKLQEAIGQSKETVYRDSGVTGGLFQKNGLAQLVRDTKTDGSSSIEDKEIEFGPIKETALPYIPHGYMPPVTQDIEKLKIFNSSFTLSGEHSDKENDDTDQYGIHLKLDDFSDEEETKHDAHNTQKKRIHGTKNYQRTAAIEIEPLYDGDGLSSAELNGLLDD